MANYYPSLNGEALKNQLALNQALERGTSLMVGLNQQWGKKELLVGLEQSLGKLKEFGGLYQAGVSGWNEHLAGKSKLEEKLAQTAKTQAQQSHQNKMGYLEAEGAKMHQIADQVNQKFQSGAEGLSRLAGNLGKAGSNFVQALGQNKNTAHQMQNFGTQVGAQAGMAYGPMGVVMGAALGGLLAKQGASFLAGGKSGPSALEQESLRLAQVFMDLKTTAVEFDKSFKASGMGTQDKSERYLELSQEAARISADQADLRAQREAALAERDQKLKQITQENKGSKASQEDRRDKVKADSQAKVEQIDKQINEKEAAKAQNTADLLPLEQDIKLFARQMEQQYKGSREKERQFFIGQKQQDFGPADYKALLEKIDQAAAGPAPTDLGERAVYLERQAELENQRIEYLQRFVEANKALVGQYEALGKQIQSKTLALERKDWGSGQYLSYLKELEGRKNSLNPNSGQYDKEVLSIQQEQFSVLSEIERTQKEEVAQNERLLASLEESKKSLEEKLFSMLSGNLSPQKAFGAKTDQYRQLLSTAQTAAPDQKNGAINAYLANFDGYLKEAKNLYKSGEGYGQIYRQLTQDLQGLLFGVGGQMGGIGAQLASQLDLQGLYRQLGSSVLSDQNRIQANLDGFLQTQGTGFNLDELAKWGVPQKAEGGVVTGPRSGFLSLLHGTEAVIPLKGGAVPVAVNLPQGEGNLVLERLLAELIDVVRAKGEGQVLVLDTQGLRQTLVTQVSEDARMGRIQLGA